MSLKDRKRKVKLENLDPEQQENIGFEMGKKITALTDKAAKQITEEINKITGIYGVEAKIQVAFYDKTTGKPL